MLGLEHSLTMLPQQVMICRSIAQTAFAGATIADHKGEKDWGILWQREGLEVALVVVVVVVVISLHERESSGELAHVDGRHGSYRD
jgi:hypothetical protein